MSLRSRGPTNTPGSTLSSMTASQSPSLNAMSLLRNTTTSVRAACKPALQPPQNPSFVSRRSVAKSSGGLLPLSTIHNSWGFAAETAWW